MFFFTKDGEVDQRSGKNAFLVPLCFVLNITMIIVLFMGLSAFQDTGGLFGNPTGNCATKAPELLEMVYAYWMWIFVTCVTILTATICVVCTDFDRHRLWRAT